MKRTIAALWKRLQQTPKSLFTLMREGRRRRRSTAKLYVVEADFELSDEKLAEYEKYLQRFRDKYGLDFLVIEKGISIKRFDEF